jgi:Trk K+ transport system NAD-binding subunit
MQPVRPEPWAVGVRLQAEPDTAHQVGVEAGSSVEGRTVAEVAEMGSEIWVSIVVRDGVLLPVHGDTKLQAGDLVTLLIDGGLPDEVTEMFTKH